LRLGVIISLAAGDGSDPRALATVARSAEAEGFDSLWVTQAAGRGFMMPDPVVALAVAATATRTVELGTAVLQLPLYEAADVALRSYTLMQIAGPRVTLGLGSGSTASDFVAFGRRAHGRSREFDARVVQLREIFADGVANGIDLTPYPASAGGPPLVLGSWGKGVERAATEFDGWMASNLHRSADDVVAALPRYRSAGGKRAIVSTITLVNDDLGELRERLSRFAEAGFDDAVILWFPGGAELSDIRACLD